jgi:NADPH:quinone reductase-like Zn-dependent oxidoreductase
MLGIRNLRSLSKMSSELPKTIKTVFQPDIQSSALILKELPTPIPKPGTTQHLIKVYATAPCAGELTWGKYFPDALFTYEGPETRLLIPCYDLAGKVVEAPPNSPFPPGTDVYTRTPATRSGNARAFTIATTEELAVKPKNLSFEEAASVPLSVFTAYQALFDHGGLTDLIDLDRKAKNQDKKVLITAAGGAVGSWVLQLARAAGVETIVGVAGTSSIDFAKSLGATDIIDYRTTSIKEWATANPDTKFDLVIDAVGGRTLEEVWYTVKPGGTLLSISGDTEKAKPADATAENVKNYFFVMEPKGEQLISVTKLLETGEAKPIVDSVFEFEDFQKAFDKLGHSRGKIIIRVSSD